MSTLRISDAPLLPDVDGTEKIPTGGRGDYAISVDQIKDHIFQDVGKELVGLGNVDNTSDLDKPVSAAQQVALDLKADKTYVDTNLELKADKTNVYTRSETSLALSKKADLVSGVIPESQIPSSFNDVLEFTTPNLPLVGEGGKIYVTTDTNKTWRWATNKYAEISGWNPDSVSKSVTLPTYYTKEGGVNSVTGVANGAYFNVRSTENDTVVDEYQNVGGSAVATGKSYPSSNALDNIPHNNLKDRDIIGAHPASAILDASGKTQQEINNAITKTFEYFNEDFIAAANWIKESTANYVELSAKEYTLPEGNVYFNRFFCRNGRVTINVPSTTYLQYGSFADDEVLHLEGIDYVVDGHRRDAYSTGYVLLYTTRTTECTCKTAFIERIQVYGMKDGSYVDDVGKTRTQGFIDYGVTDFSYINDVKTYGVSQFATIKPLSENAQHFERNFTGVNCETGIYYPRGLTWLSGDTENMQIINTLTQRGYWCGMSAGRVNNGMDVIMNEASYATKYRLRKIYAKCAIERSIYVMSDNADVADIEDVESDTMGSCKSQMLTTPLTRVWAANFRARDIKNTGQKLNLYGSDNIVIDGLEYHQGARDGSRFMTLTNTNYCELRNFKVANINQLFYYTPESPSNKLGFINFDVKDSYASNAHYVFGQADGGNNIGELYFDNFKMSVPHNIVASDMYYQAIDARKVSRFIAKNSHFYINLGLYQYDASLTFAELTDVKVSVITSATLNSIFGTLSNSTTNYIAANIFDVLIDIKSTTTPNIKTQVKCIKQSDTGLANCAQNWKDISLEIPVTTAPASYPLFSFGAVSYFVDVEFAGSIMKYFYDATNNTITEQVNAGGKLATGAPQVGKITFSVANGSNYRIDIAVGDGTWSGVLGTLRVKIHR